jgi:hypothetical protein
MLSDSPITIFEPEVLQRAESIFWARPGGRVQLHYFRPARSIAYEPHTHSEYNVVICLAGAVSKTQMGFTETIEPGEAFMGNFGVQHASSYLAGSKGCETLCVAADPRDLADVLDDAGWRYGRIVPVFLGKVRSSALYACAVDGAHELQTRRDGYDIVLGGLAMRMLVETLRRWPLSGVERRLVDLSPRLLRRDFIRTCDFMRRREDAFRLERLCRLLGTSNERFTRLFQATTGTTPAVFYNRIRKGGIISEP